MGTEPTGRQTFGDLVLEAALEMGIAYYGTAGTSAAAIPIDVHDLAEVKRHVNNGIRMFFSNGPPSGGWRWRRPVASLILWPAVALKSTVTVSGGSFSGGVTTVTATAASFHPSMETKSIVITGIGTFVIKTYTSTTVIVVTGDASAASAKTFSIAANGDYTLPSSFGGAYTGDITFAAETGDASTIAWSDEGAIRHMRESDLQLDTPRLAAPRVQTDGRRWDLIVWPVPSAQITVEFPFYLYFAELTDTTNDLPPIPFLLDEAVRAAVLKVVERDVHKLTGHHSEYYDEVALPSAWVEDGRSAPRRLGYFGNVPNAITPRNFRDFRDRPNVVTTNI